MVKKGTDAVMTTNKYRSDERMGVARLVRPGEEAAVERDTLPRAGACSLHAPGCGQTQGRGQVASFQFPKQYALFFWPYLLWCFSNYNEFAFF